MTAPSRARMILTASLSLACAHTDGSASADPRPDERAPATTPAEPVTVARVCQHGWALISAESTASSEAVPEFEFFMQLCTTHSDARRQAIGEDEYRHWTSCQIAATKAAEWFACEPDIGPPHGPAPDPAVSPREPTRFPEGVEVRSAAEVMTHALHSPNPAMEDLQQTKAARFDKIDGIGVVAYCVDTDGSTSDIHTIQKFPGDPRIDEILRDTIAAWRFQPFSADGAAIKVCTERQFVLRFKPSPPH